MHGGDPAIHELRLSRLEDASLFPERGQDGSKSSFSTAVILIVKALVSTAPFRIHQTLQAGIISCVIITIAMLLVNQCSFYIFVRTWAYDQAYSYPEVWAFAFGKRTSWIAGVIVIVGFITFPMIRASETIIYVTDALARYWPSAPSWVASKWTIRYLFVIIATFPAAMTTRFSWFGPLSWLCFASQMTCFACLVIHFMRNGSQYEVGSTTKIAWFGSDWRAIVNAMNEFCTAFFAHTQIAPPIREMFYPSRRRTFKATWVANLICWFLSFFGPLFAFLCYPDAPGGSIFHLAFDQESVEIVVGKFAILLSCLLSAQYAIFFIGGAAAELISGNSSQKSIPAFASGFTVALFIIAFGLLGDAPRKICSEITYQCLLALAYGLPPAYYIGQFGVTEIWGVIAVAMVVLGLLMSGWSLSVLIVGLVNAE